MQNKILLVEDDKDLREFTQELLMDNNFQVESVADGAAALNRIRTIQPDLVVLDLGLPTIDGETVCREIKKNNPEIPVIILTARGTTSEIVHGLNIGADDYITKPFSGDEFLARVKARLRSLGSEETMQINDLVLDNKAFKVTRSGKHIQLTPQEYKLLEYLMNNKNRILTREMILNRVWGFSPDVETRVVDVYVGYLRKKIDAGNKKKLIHSVRGFGYSIKD